MRFFSSGNFATIGLLLVNSGSCIRSGRKYGETFDYIVVGAGPTGSMVAMGLAEKGFNTLLIDAGPDYNSANVTTPAFHVRASEDANIAWDFYVKHYDESTGMRQNVLYPRVGGVGGCSLHNAMIHILPNKEDFDRMVEVTGLESWSEPNMRSYYNRIVKPNAMERLAPMRALNHLGTTFQKVSSAATNMLSDKSGAWLKLSTVDVFNILSNDQKLFDLASNILREALMSNILGFDINSYLGVGQPAIDSENTFLIPINTDVAQGHKRVGVMERLNQLRTELPLTVWTDTLATKILMTSKNVAYGVKFLKGKFLYKAGKRVNSSGGKPGIAYAKREIIVSGGTFNTPQLMMLSGIGDARHLKQMGIKPKVHNSNVGRNLHDRYEVSVNFQFDSPFTVLDGCLFRGDDTDPCFKRFNESSTGPYSFSGILTGSTIKSSPELSVPDVFMLTAPINFWGYHTGMGDEVVENKDVFTILILKAHTKNRQGYVRLNSNDPRDVPDINFRYFQEGADQDIPPMIKGIRQAREIMKKFSSGYTEANPGEHIQTDAQLTKHIRENAWGHHATGTMKMGRQGDPTAVLDGNFKVLNTTNLRVADMSIFGDIPGYFPVLTLYMVGAKAADAILADAY